MAYLLDTHVLLWWLTDDPRLPDGVRTLIANPDHDIYVSAASGWEIGIKKSLGKLEAPHDLAVQLEQEGFQELPIRFQNGEDAGQLPPLHRDPFDRMLIAQAQAYDLILVTADAEIPSYPVRTFWS